MENGKPKKILLLDLDETLVHSEKYKKGVQYDFIVDFMDRFDTTFQVSSILSLRVSVYTSGPMPRNSSRK